MDPALLKDLALFSAWNERDIGALSTVMVQRTFSDGDIILEQGERRHGAFVLLSGSVRVERRLPDESSVDLVSLQRGALFGTLAVMDGGPRAARCIASGAVFCAEVPRAEFLSLLESRTTLAFQFQLLVLRDMCQDVRAANLRLAELVSLPEQEEGLVQLSSVFAGLS